MPVPANQPPNRSELTNDVSGGEPESSRSLALLHRRHLVRQQYQLGLGTELCRQLAAHLEERRHLFRGKGGQFTMELRSFKIKAAHPGTRLFKIVLISISSHRNEIAGY